MKTPIEKMNDWLQEQIIEYPFSEIAVRFFIHNGKIKRIERTIVEKEQLNDC